MPRITVAQHERQLNRVNRRRQHWTAAGERQDADRDRHRPLREAPALARQTAQSQNSVSDARRRTFPSSTDVSRNFFVAHKTCRRMLASQCLIKHVIRVTPHKASITFCDSYSFFRSTFGRHASQASFSEGSLVSFHITHVECINQLDVSIWGAEPGINCFVESELSLSFVLLALDSPTPNNM